MHAADLSVLSGGASGSSMPSSAGLATHDAEICEMSVSEVIQEVQKGIPFIRGITVSGGECMLQESFLLELFRAVHGLDKGLTCYVDTNGTIPFSEELLAETDGVLLDVKAWDLSVWQRVAGYAVIASATSYKDTHDIATPQAQQKIATPSQSQVSINIPIHAAARKTHEALMHNLRTLLSLDKIVEVRVVCLPLEGPIQTDVEAILQGIHYVADSLHKPMPKLHLIPFRPHGVVGPMAEVPMPTPEEMQHYHQLAALLANPRNAQSF